MVLSVRPMRGRKRLSVVRLHRVAECARGFDNGFGLTGRDYQPSHFFECEHFLEVDRVAFSVKPDSVNQVNHPRVCVRVFKWLT